MSAAAGRRAGRLLAWALAGATLLGGLAVAGVAGMLYWYGRDLETIDEAALRAYQPPQVTRVFARDGETLLGEVFEQRRTLIDYEDVPSHVENAFLAAEDAEFHRHEGLDYVGILRALFVNVRAGRVRQGASTITQQVVKNFILSPERTFKRKVHELLLARRLERVLSKREILELYLNEIYLGHGRYGIQEASRFYFGKDVEQIDVGQAALLATLPKAPGASTPYKAPERAKERQVYVLRQMARHGFEDAANVRRFIEAPLDVLPWEAPRGLRYEGAEAFVDQVVSRLRERFGEDLGHLGARVITTLDPAVQEDARAGLRAQLQAIDVRQRYAHGIQRASDRARARALKRGAKAQKTGQVGAVVIETSPAPASLGRPGFLGRLGEQLVFVEVPDGSRYDEPERSIAAQFPEGGITVAQLRRAPQDLDLPEGTRYATIGSGPEAAVVVAEIETGDVLAWVSGYEDTRGGFNRISRARRQPGSTFKPFVYGAALESRRFTAASQVVDSPEIYAKWRPTNFERDRYRGAIRMREALTHSVNTVAIKLLDAIGVDAARDFARRAGIESELTPNLSLALGTSEVTPVELLRAYLTLARGGQRRAMRFVSRVEYGGGVLEQPPSPATQVISPEVAFIVGSLLESVVREGTGRRARDLGSHVAGKTGTAAENRDAWFAGFGERYAAVAWVGFDRPRSLGKGETGGRAALPIWVSAMRSAMTHGPRGGRDDRGDGGDGSETGPRGPGRQVTPPAGIEVRTIDRASGLLANASPAAGGGARASMDEFFLRGTEPTTRVQPEVLDLDSLALELLVPGEATGSQGEGVADGSAGGDPRVAPSPEPDVPSPSRADLKPVGTAILPGRAAPRGSAEPSESSESSESAESTADPRANGEPTQRLPVPPGRGAPTLPSVLDAP